MNRFDNQMPGYNSLPVLPADSLVSQTAALSEQDTDSQSAPAGLDERPAIALLYGDDGAMGDPRAVVGARLSQYDIEPAEALGQNILVDTQVLQTIGSLVVSGASVIEIGSGPGQLTEVLAQRAAHVTGIEIDPRYRALLTALQDTVDNVHFILGDAMKLSLRQLIREHDETQIIANLPFHLTEPVLRRLVDLPVINAVLMLGKTAATDIQRAADSESFSRTSLLGQTFFHLRTVTPVDRSAFIPVPPTDAAVVELEPRNRHEVNASPLTYVLAYLFRREGRSGLVVNDLKQAMVEANTAPRQGETKRATSKRARVAARRSLQELEGTHTASERDEVTESASRQKSNLLILQKRALAAVRVMGIADETLGKPFRRLNNSELRSLALRLRDHYGGWVDGASG